MAASTSIVFSTGAGERFFRYQSDACSSSHPPEVLKAFEHLTSSVCSTPLSSICVTTSVEIYQSLVGHLSVAQVNTIEKRLKLFSESDVNKWFGSFKINGSVVGNPLIALRAVKEGKITIMEFSTIVIRWLISELKPENLETVPLFNEKGFPSHRAKAIISETLVHWYIRTSQDLTSSQFRDFFEEMKMLPYSEQQFFLIPDVDPDFKIADESFDAPKLILEDVLSNRRSISHDITGTAGINIFSRFIEGDRKLRMIPSFGMMQTYVKVKYPTTYVKIKPIIGVASVDMIAAGGKTQTRLMSLPFPGIQLPKTADELNAENPWDFVYHDFYHALIASGVSPKYQKAFIFISEIVKELKDEPKFKPYELIITSFYEQFIDMEFNKFYDLGDTDIIFWQQVNDRFAQALVFSVVKLLKSKGIKSFKKAKMQMNAFNVNTRSFLEDGAFFDLFADKIVSRQNELKELGIGFKSVIIVSQMAQKNIRDLISNAFDADKRSIEKGFNSHICIQLHKKLFPVDYELCCTLG